MEITFDCIPCMLKQALESSRMVTNDIDKQEKIMEEALSVLLNFKLYRNSPDLARKIHQIIKNLLVIKVVIVLLKVHYVQH